MTSTISICGLDCSTCPEFEKQCAGCVAISGKVFWSTHFNLDKCPLHKCCTDDHSFAHCGQCDQLPCKTYFDMRDPSSTDEQHQESIKNRVEVLRGL
ncbi:hypothetical protein SDC9_57513 [bioreactor metagenome]|uniref:DUF3795 domain-containing protein n=1 Tax=bioreactor metagenome TaxID=1076179 RepID=A0A644XAL2_9ZZZZ